MRWLAQRQSVLADNIANADTPDFMPSDVKPLDFKNVLSQGAQVSLARTDPRHLEHSSAQTKALRTNLKHISPVAGETFPIEQKRRSFETDINKNGVVLEEQMALMDDTRGQHERVTALFKKNVALLETALGVK